MTPLGIAKATATSSSLEEEQDRIHLNSNVNSNPTETTTSTSSSARSTGTGRSAPVSRSMEYQTTSEGDVLIVQPSFDDPGRKTPPEASECQTRSPSQGGKPCDLEVRNPVSPRKPSVIPSVIHHHIQHGHSRQLSAHFYDATSLKEKDEQDDLHVDGEGRKHRRIFSGDLTNPSQLHRRLDSRGARGPIRRDGRFHHRDDSAGLDILSAAADATNDELADAVGMATTASPMISPWEPPSHHTITAVARPSMGPVPTESYDSAYVPTHAMPPPSRPLHTSMSSYPPYMPPSQVPPYPPSHYSYPPPPPPPPPPHYYCPPGGSLPHHPGAMPRPPYALQRPSGIHPIYPEEHPPHSRRPLIDSWDHAPQQQQQHHAPSSQQQQHHAPSPTEGEFRNKQSNHQGSQTFVTAIAVGSGTKTLQPNNSATTKNASTNTTPQQQLDTVPSHIRHHRKLSSFSSIGTLLGSGLFSPNEGSGGGGPELRPGGAHHRKTSSTLSFLQGLDVGLDSADDQFLKNLQASAAAAGVDYRASTPQHMRYVPSAPPPQPPPPPPTAAATPPVPSSSASISTTATAPTTATTSAASASVSFVAAVQPVASSMSSRSTCVVDSTTGSGPTASLLAAAAVAAASNAPDAVAASQQQHQQQLQQTSLDEDEEDELWDEHGSKLASGGTSKRLRRKCTIPDCQNRVVQGGLCISHGARRKTCKHPGCNKNVKKAGLCSTHGPARKRCEHEGCSKVAVQGGRCIAHGAKKKLCLVSGCTKQAILSGMCKKHHDQASARGGGMIGGVVVEGDTSTTLHHPHQEQPDIKYCQEIKAVSSVAHAHTTQPRKPTHTRGLSIFQEISPDAVNELLNDEPLNQQY